jgi:lipoprotein-anchoring transpeptidase ErfK/SrfK
VVDKSDYRLYWVKDGVLAEVYPIAHGRNGCTPVGTWRIDAKYHTSPTSVYGPRKMRMFRQIGPGRFTFTAYAIHGTNQPWVIGTQASAGCIRMYNSDVLELFPKVPLRTMCVTRE